MQPFLERLRRCVENHTIDSGDPDCKTVLDQLFRAYQESHESDPPDIRDSFRELDALLGHLPLDDNNTVFNLCWRSLSVVSFLSQCGCCSFCNNHLCKIQLRTPASIQGNGTMSGLSE